MEALVKFDKGPGNVRLQEMPDPKVEEGKVIMEVNSCGICGTDLHVYHDTFKNYPPVILGHEFSAKVIEKGKNTDGIDLGARYSVLGALTVICNNCEYCHSGEFMFCKAKRGMGHGVHGAFTKYVAARPDQLYATANHVSDAVSALVEPFAVAVHAVGEIANLQFGDTVLLSGPGPIGMLLLKLLLAQGVKTIVAGTGEDVEKLRTAKDWGAHTVVKVDQEDLQTIIQHETNGKGVDIAFETAGAQASVSNCLNALRPLGQYIQVGHFGKDITIPFDLSAFRQLIIKGSVGYTRATWDRAVEIINQGQVDLEDVITHRMPLADWQKGFDLMEKKKSLKILLYPS
ncbi:alcohol dehydrogenase catalytic domain-containing protein [Flavobacteriaceae bacterium TP-CH-4]|uniref:Alcohol dehydrogenase catalytic domain-containing protein n=1 Tax=Pelagihabitans pacificus TaxID=2696054 RepID=A0A967E5U0_9FLAO|nr:alcohol dehydrogenase catalytic domain-containing protein [Pelagihabitans pacificus]NHF58935.1 alcohol dehydrogenase catalytic domain-containing protein [Pelagihabitans pacificus]